MVGLLLLGHFSVIFTHTDVGVAARDQRGDVSTVRILTREAPRRGLLHALFGANVVPCRVTQSCLKDRIVKVDNTSRHYRLVKLPGALTDVGLPALLDDPRFASMAARLDNTDAIEAIVAGWMRVHDADVLVAKLEAEGLPCAKVARIDEVVASEQLRHREGIVDIPFAGGSVPMQGVTMHLSETPLAVRSAIPAVGTHTAEVLRDWLGDDGRRAAALAALADPA